VAGSTYVGSTVAHTYVRMHVRNWANVGDLLKWGILLGRAADVGTAAPATALAATDQLSWAYRSFELPSVMNNVIVAADTRDFETKAKRRVRNANDAYILCLQNAGADSLTLDLYVRTVVALA
jgi:hypothetical protein